MSSGNRKRRFFERDASPVVASDEDFDAVFTSMTAQGASIAQDIPIERIRANPFQARVKFTDIESLAELDADAWVYQPASGPSRPRPAAVFPARVRRAALAGCAGRGHGGDFL